MKPSRRPTSRTTRTPQPRHERHPSNPPGHTDQTSQEPRRRRVDEDPSRSPASVLNAKAAKKINRRERKRDRRPSAIRGSRTSMQRRKILRRQKRSQLSHNPTRLGLAKRATSRRTGSERTIRDSHPGILNVAAGANRSSDHARRAVVRATASVITTIVGTPPDVPKRKKGRPG